jgi:hypothetical protein
MTAAQQWIALPQLAAGSDADITSRLTHMVCLLQMHCQRMSAAGAKAAVVISCKLWAVSLLFGKGLW